MSELLKKHRAVAANDADAELEDELIEEMDSMPEPPDDSRDEDAPSDPRWDKLKDLQ